MKKFLLPSILILLFSSLVFAGQEITDDMFYFDKCLLILKTTKDYNEAVSFASKASEKLDREFKNEHVEYSEEKGIYYAETLPDGMYRGKYYPRRYSGEHISLENSSGYKGLTPGFIIVLGGIYDNHAEAKEALAKTRESHKDAYVKKTNMWMGCIH